MRVLFLESSPVWINTLPRGFFDAGHQVMISGPLTEKNIPQMISVFKPDLIMSIGWGIENSICKQGWIKEHVEKAGVPLVYWAVEDSAFTEAWSLPLIKNIQPAFVFTISPSTLNYYTEQGIKAAYLDFGYHPDIHYPVDVHPQYRCSVAVVANAYPDILERYPEHYRFTSLLTLVRPLLEKNIRVDFWGRNWDEMKRFLGIDIPRDWIHGYLPYKEANCVYSSASITIGLQNYPSQVTQRTYEILGSGGFLLTNHTPGVRYLFKPGRDLIVSSSPDETVQLVRYYLKHPEQRNIIRKQGQSSVLNHAYVERAKYMVKVLVEQGILSQGINTAKEGAEIYYYANFSEEKYELYVVNPNDTLWGISKKFGITINELKELNDLTSDEIYINQVLKIREITVTSQSSSKDSANISKSLPEDQQIKKWIKPIVEICAEYGIPSNILFSIMVVESSGNPNAVSRTQGIGLMQLRPETANWLGVNPLDPIQSIDGAARYLKQLHEQFHDWKLAVAAYNAGPDQVEKYKGIPPMEQPQNYVQKVFSYSEAINLDD